MGKTSIEWTDHSWPIVNGCRRVSRGCEACYAERLAGTRLSRTPKYQGLTAIGKNGPRWTGEARLWVPHLELPLKIRKPSRIFVADMGDLFYERVPDETIAAVFGVMAACPQHTFQVLTKRPARMRAWFDLLARGPSHPREIIGAHTQNLIDIDVPGGGWPLPNVWLGVSAEDQATADERIPLLLQTPAAVRFISAEPLLGPIDLRRYVGPSVPARLSWVIVGGESGPGARPFDVGWARLMVAQCRDAAVACFVKQLGARPIGDARDAINYQTQGSHQGERWWFGLADRKGGDPAEWPNDLRVRQFPAVAR